MGWTLGAALALPGCAPRGEALHGTIATRPPERRAAFDPRVVRPRPGSPTGEVRAHLDAGDVDAALALAIEALSGATPEEAGRLEWLIADAYKRKGLWRKGLGHLDALAKMDHPLARWARLRWARSLENVEPRIAAREAARLTDRWAGRWRARVTEARAWLYAGEPSVAVPKLRALVAETPSRYGAATAGMPLAEQLASTGDPHREEEALAIYRRVASRAPATEVGKRAESLAKALLDSLPPARQEALAKPSAEDRLASAELAYRAMRYGDALDAFADLSSDEDVAPDLRCRAQWMQGRTLIRARERERGAALLVDVAARCRDEDTVAWARYGAARALEDSGRRAEARAQYLAIERTTPHHRLADDARLRRALLLGRDGQTAQMIALLDSLPRDYPDGDMREEALFRLAWLARSRYELEAALRYLDRAIALDAPPTHEDLLGRARYWRARTLAELGEDARANAAYADVIAHAPLSYYAQRASERLERRAPPMARQVRATQARAGDGAAAAAGAAGATGAGGATPLTFAWRSAFDAPGFTRAIELLRVGALQRARKELDDLEQRFPDQGLVWVTAAVLSEAGDAAGAARLIGRRLDGYRREAPVGRARALWALAYPRLFSAELNDAAERAGVPLALVQAVAREESGFEPAAVSPAGARGLMQVMRPTGREVARRIGVPVRPGFLLDPATNARIGAQYLRTVADRFGDDFALAPAAYNAGGTPVARWVRAHRGEPLDVLVEDIPYAETRHYTRRVLQTWGIYHWLATGTLPQLPKALPRLD
ncbi:MAG: transglycosylase SLT domain-containing protein [Myxococcales bacterium]|nr:transglycosylase SLT domain-containing protein [Myxococcales bacterium]